MSKYGNKKVLIDGIKFDSIAEGRRYKELKLMQRAGIIKELELQPRFLLQESFKKNKKTYKKIEYIADFKYIENGKVIIEDVKSKATKTQVYKIKKKLFEYKFREYEIKEIEN